MKDIYFWSGVLVGSFLFLPYQVTLLLAFILTCFFERYYMSLGVVFLLDLSAEGIHGLSFSLLTPFNHLYFPLTVLGVLTFFLIGFLKRFVWIERV